MSTEYGVWDDEAGGFVAGSSWSPEEAERDRQTLLAEYDEDERERGAADLTVRAFCSEHRDEEQPADGCEPCNAEPEEDDGPPEQTWAEYRGEK